MKCPYCMETINDGAIKCKYCKSEFFTTNPNCKNNVEINYNIGSTQKATPWFQITSVITGVIILLISLVTKFWDNETISGGFFIALLQLSISIGAIKTGKEGRGFAITGLILGSISSIIIMSKIIE